MCLTCMTAWVMYAITAVTMFAGVTLLGVGAALAADVDKYIEEILTKLIDEGLDGDLYLAAVYIMIPVGILLCVSAGLGCWGSWRRKPFWLTLFNICAMVILVMALVSGILASVYKASFDEQVVQNQFENQVKLQYSKENEITNAWDTMQDHLSCCGATTYKDYRGSSFKNDTNNAVPWSCCVKYNGQADGGTDYEQCNLEAGKDAADISIVNEEGCLFKFQSDVDSNSDVIMGVCFSLGLLNLIAVLIGCFLKGRLEDEDVS